MVNYALWDDVTKVAPIPLPISIQARINEYIVQASVRLRMLVLGLDNRLASGDLEPDLVKGIVVDAVLRLAYNPTGAQSQTAGPYTMSKSAGRFGEAASDSIGFDPALLALLTPNPTIPGTFGVSVAWQPGLPQIKTLPGFTGMPFPGPVPVSEALDSFSGYPYTPESVRAVWAYYGTPNWTY